ncbi:MAG: CoA-binding protein [Gemmatimonadetes bacterium]|nr:CoA-binding protein [Gemmatimonadota bacterium]NNM05281.1 CoA-binding protein [Gemmatimonadota bacterium]
MKKIPESIEEFLAGERLAVTGVSRNSKQPGNAIYRRLIASGFQVTPVNPRATEVEGVKSYPDLVSLPGPVDGVVVASPPASSAQIIRDCKELGVSRVWLHRSFGTGSVSKEAVRECENLGINCIVGGCPLMFCEPVDFGHKCMRWWLQRKGRVPR